MIALDDDGKCPPTRRLFAQLNGPRPNRSRLTLPPLRTQTTLEPRGTSISPFNSAPTGAAAAPSMTSLQRDITQSTASKISTSGKVTIWSTNCSDAPKEGRESALACSARRSQQCVTTRSPRQLSTPPCGERRLRLWRIHDALVEKTLISALPFAHD